MSKLFLQNKYCDFYARSKNLLIYLYGVTCTGFVHWWIQDTIQLGLKGQPREGTKMVIYSR